MEREKYMRKKCIVIPNNLSSLTREYLEICHQSISLFPSGFLVSVDLHPGLFSLRVL
jgi:hypothetical protein